MSTRIVFEVTGQDPQWNEIEEYLRRQGATNIRRGASGPFGTAVLENDAQIDSVLERLRAMDGVGSAERDAWRTTL
jgi:hypothetical protein